MELELKRLLNKNVQIFDRWPLLRYTPIFADTISNIFKHLPYEICEFIAHYVPISPSVHSLCQQLNIFDLSTEITEKTMNRLSLLARTNFILMSKLDLMYGLTKDVKIFIIDNKFDSTLVIYTTEDDVFDYEDQLEILHHYHLVEEKMFREYLINFDNINKYTLTGNEEYNIKEYQTAFDTFSGTQYDRIMSAAFRYIECLPTCTETPIQLNEFATTIMMNIAGTNIITIMIIGEEYYVFGDYGGMGFSIFEIHDDGSMSISAITSQTALEKYRLGDVSRLVSSTRMI